MSPEGRGEWAPRGPMPVWALRPSELGLRQRVPQPGSRSEARDPTGLSPDCRGHKRTTDKWLSLSEPLPLCRRRTVDGDGACSRLRDDCGTMQVRCVT